MMLRKFLLMLVLFGMTYTFAVGQTADRLPLRLKVGVYNLGHFNQGRVGGFQGTGNWMKAELVRWKNWVGEQGLDIFAVNEWSHYFDKDSTRVASDEILKPFYNNIYFGKEHKWIYNGIATNYTLENIRQENWDGDYYAILGDLKIGDKVITIISSHIPWQKDWHARSLDALVNMLKKYEYFICMGDMNASDNGQLKFTNAGFNMANGGSMGWFATAAGGNTAEGRTGAVPNKSIDNIVTSSNIKIMQVKAPFTTLNDLDHLPILADVIITW
ncbi:endonuclease/exonuclease/phosphatase family protein [Sphingobacterium psychroaquaticum]|uniref:endonuclease/exonuclease/phosphatase family protein n=1 Tax=Sphingobacterium psychroaquaticum TaxID=561061 RepID=UPI0019D2514F|nr:endonuclease/exonuclease/phosphatase family protein [Sphingobacterium psychroaquaticum]